MNKKCNNKNNGIARIINECVVCTRRCCKCYMHSDNHLLWFSGRNRYKCMHFVRVFFSWTIFTVLHNRSIHIHVSHMYSVDYSSSFFCEIIIMLFVCVVCSGWCWCTTKSNSIIQYSLSNKASLYPEWRAPSYIQKLITMQHSSKWTLQTQEKSEKKKSEQKNKANHQGKWNKWNLSDSDGIHRVCVCVCLCMNNGVCLCMNTE